MSQPQLHYSLYWTLIVLNSKYLNHIYITVYSEPPKFINHTGNYITFYLENPQMSQPQLHYSLYWTPKCLNHSCIRHCSEPPNVSTIPVTRIPLFLENPQVSQPLLYLSLFWTPNCLNHNYNCITLLFWTLNFSASTKLPVVKDPQMLRLQLLSSLFWNS